ncbi:MAG: ABC transporter substrate-binding protein, partial [Dermatophilaceae bacterium]
VAVVALLPLLVGCAATADSPDGEATTTRATSLTHDAGTLDLDDVPERVVTTSDEVTELVVALGMKPVGAGSTRVDATAADPWAGYYVDRARLGEPRFVGGAETNHEAVAASRPDLVVHGADDEVAEDLGRIAPTAVFDTTAPGSWQKALTALGAATGREDRAREVIDGYEKQVAAARTELAAVVDRTPRVAVIYPEYRGGTDNYLFDADFALAEVVPQLGFTLAGSPKAEEAFPGVRSISAELYPTIDADLILALGTRPWQQTRSAAVLGSLDVPVVGVTLDDGQPAAGPLTSPVLLDRYVEALTRT